MLTRALFVLLLPAFAVAEQVPVRIGVALPLTGEYGTWGERVRQGLLLAQEDTKHRFSFNFQDEANCDARATLSAVHTFLSVDNTKILFMGCLAGTKAAAPVAAREGAILFSTGLLDDEVYAKRYPVINLATQLSTESRYLAAHIRSTGMKKVALLRWPDAFGEEFARSLKDELQRFNIEVPMDESTSTMGADYRSILLRVKQSGADALATNLGDAQIRNLMRQVRDNQLKLRIFSNYVVETNTAPATLLNGVEYTYPVNAADESEEKRRFDTRFKERFGGEAPSANSYFAYDGLRILDDALQHCLPSEPGCVRAVILKSKRAGLSGQVSFQPDGSNERPYGIKRIENGKFVWLHR